MFNQTMKEFGRVQLHDIWLKAKAGESFDDSEENNLARAMLEHSEYHHVWERLDKMKGDEVIENGVNTIMHVTMHTAMENQLEQNTPPETQKALDGLLKRGTTRHEAIHAIAYEFTMELHKTLQTSRPFNNIAYKRRLEKLAGKKRF